MVSVEQRAQLRARLMAAIDVCVRSFAHSFTVPARSLYAEIDGPDGPGWLRYISDALQEAVDQFASAGEEKSVFDSSKPTRDTIGKALSHWTDRQLIE